MSGTTARYSLTHGIPAVRIGWLVAEARSAAGLTQDDLADKLGLRKRAVKRWEKGAQIPSDDEVLAVARACGIGVGKLLPPRDTVEFDRTARSLRVGGSVVSVADVHNEAVLTIYVQLVRQQRGLAPDAPFDIRHEDVDALANTLDLDDDDLEARLVAIVGLPVEAAATMRERLLSRRRLGLPAGIVVGSLGLVPGVGGQEAQAVSSRPAAVAAPAPATSAVPDRLTPAAGETASTVADPAPWADVVLPAEESLPAAATPVPVAAPPAPAAPEIGDAVTIAHSDTAPPAGA